MIKINLLGDDGGQDPAGIVWVGGFLSGVFIFLLSCFLLNSSMLSAIESNKDKEASLQTEFATLQKKTKEVRELEKKRKELSDKLAVIARLKKSKAGPVRVLDDLNIGIPERAWLIDVKESSRVLKMRGYALDNQTIAEFMKRLEVSDYFKNIELVETKQSIKKGTKIKEFMLQAQVNYAGKVAILSEANKDKKKKG